MAKTKRGPMSPDERKYIEKHAEDSKIKDIAQFLRRSEDSIRRYVAKNEIFSPDVLDVSDDDAKILKNLKNLPWWETVPDQFTEKEVKRFQQQWIRLYKQFDYDVLPSEEIQIKKFITLDIMRDRSLKKLKSSDVDMEIKQKLLAEELEKPKRERDRDLVTSLNNEIDRIRQMVPGTSKEVQSLIQEQNKIEDLLSASRNHRVKNIQDATKNWSNILRLLEDSENRKKLGQHLELMRAARDKEMVRLTKEHKFIDGSFDRPFLSGKLDKEYYEDSHS